MTDVRNSFLSGLAAMVGSPAARGMSRLPLKV